MEYDKIISLPHPTLKKHYPMSLYNRAAQFAPFAALSGYDEACSEVTRLTDRQIELDDDRAAELDKKIQLLTENACELPKITATYFVPDKSKDGGAYKTVTGCFRRVDGETYDIILTDGTVIPAEWLYSLDGDIFDRIFKS